MREAGEGPSRWEPEWPGSKWRQEPPPGCLPTVWRWCVRLAFRFPLEVAGPLPLPSSDSPGRFRFGFLKSRTHYSSKSPSSSCQREPAFHSVALPPTLCLYTQGNRRPSSMWASPQDFGDCHSGPGDRGEDSQELARSHPTIPGTRSSTWSSAALQDKEECFYQPNVLLTNA